MLMTYCLTRCSAGRVLPGFVELLTALPQHPDAHAAFEAHTGASSHTASPVSQRGTPLGSPRKAPPLMNSRYFADLQHACGCDLQSRDARDAGARDLEGSDASLAVVHRAG